MAEGEVAVEPVKRRRKSRSPRRDSGSWVAFGRGRQFGLLVFAGMTLLGAAYTGKYLYDTRLATILYAGTVVGVPAASELRYVFGTPDSIEEGGRVHRYDDKKRIITARFADDGRLASISCTAEPDNSAYCEEVLDIRIGELEDQILLALGAPSRVTYTGNDKIMHYDGMGLSFRMRKYRLYAIELHDGGHLMGYLPRAVWQMIP